MSEIVPEAGKFESQSGISVCSLDVSQEEKGKYSGQTENGNGNLEPELPSAAVNLARELEVSVGLVKKTARTLAEDIPDSIVRLRLDNKKWAEHYEPELTGRIKLALSNRGRPKVGWLTASSIASQVGTDVATIKRLISRLEAEEQELTSELKGTSTSTPALHFDPSSVSKIAAEYAKHQPKPEGAASNKALAKELGASQETITAIAASLAQRYPGQVVAQKGSTGRVSDYYQPELVAAIKEERGRSVPAPKGSYTRHGLAVKFGIDDYTVDAIIEELRPQYQESMGYHRCGNGIVREHIYDDYVAAIEVRVNGLLEGGRPPEGAQSIRAIAEEISANRKYVERIAGEVGALSNGCFGVFRASNGNRVTYLYKESSERVKAQIHIYREIKANNGVHPEQIKLQNNLKNFIIEIGEGESIEAQDFESLVSLFGSDYAVDILYQQHPEYRKLPVPYVKSALTDYLGEYLIVRGQFSLEGLEKGIGLLAETVFRDGLTEIVKADCLRALHDAGQLEPDDASAALVADYIAHIRAETADFITPELESVLDEAEAYYKLIFENIHKPDHLVDSLGDDRLFPDINQRINVQEIAFKHRMLIADEMGLGKSASAIMAKEILGVQQALVIVPSNVVEVWQDFLSSEVDDKGKQKGYFKPGQEPRVLIVGSPEDLTDVEPNDYDYVVISQERLNGIYTPLLKQLPFDMLITDEVHKLKNLKTGVRSEYLLELAEQVSGDDKYLVMLSGTPVPNTISDVALSLKLLYPEQFADIENKELVNQIINGDILDLRSLLVPRMQQKELAESINMPAIREEVVRFELTPEEQEVYSLLVEEDELSPMDKLRILRQFTLNPQMFDATPNIEGSKQFAVSAALHQTFAVKDKVVMFVNDYIDGVMRGDNHILDTLDIPRDVQVFTVDGSIKKERRLEIQNELRQTNQKVLLVVSGQTADVGVDFSAAEEVYFYNEPWTVYDKHQQRSRVYRPGLKQDLIVRTFVAAGTIEDGIHRYIQTKYQAVQKLLRGVPISEIEREMLRQAEKQVDPNLEVNSELAEYYFSSWDKMMRIYGHVKELGEEDFKKFLVQYDQEYAESYANLVGARSYQANVARLSGTLIHAFVAERKQDAKNLRVLDVASGPEMLKRHISEELAEAVVSVDINPKHFAKAGVQQIVGSFTNLPAQDGSMDYVNLSLGLHYTSFVPSRKNVERLQVLRELNRVLKPGGKAVVDMIYSLDLEDSETFVKSMDELGFVIDDRSGIALSGSNFRSQVIVLEKVRDCEKSAPELAGLIGAAGIKSLKFKKTKESLRDSRKMAVAFEIGEHVVETVFNEDDQTILAEEQAVLRRMDDLKATYGGVAMIPREEVLRSGFARVFNGKRYVLFKRLSSESGAVAIR